MNKNIKFMLPLVLVFSLAGCKGNKTSNSIRPSTPNTTVVPSTPLPPGSDETGVNLTLDLADVEVDTKPSFKDDWSSTFTYTYDKAIVLKKTTDFVMTPPFKTSKGLSVKITGFLEKGSTADGKLTVKIEGLSRDSKAVETVEVKESEIKGTKEQPVEFTVNLANTAKDISRVKISIGTVGRVTNFGITHLEIQSK